MKKLIFSAITFCLFNVNLFADRLDVLMIGNSYTGWSYPTLVSLFEASGIDYYMKRAVKGKSGLWNHHLHIPETVDAIKERDWDVIVLQDLSWNPAYTLAADEGGWHEGYTFEDYLHIEVEPLYDLIQQHSPNARIVYYATPAYKLGHDEYKTLYDNDMATMAGYTNRAYEMMNSAFNHSGKDEVAYVSNAFIEAYTQKPDRNLHDPDLSHHNKKGFYLIASTLFNYITKVSSTGLSIENDLKEEDIRDFETIAKQVSGAPIVPWGKVQLQYNEQEDKVTLVQGEPVGEVLNLYRNQKPKEKWTTVQFKRPYSSPVVVAGPLTFRGTDPAAVRVRNITQTSCEVQFQEFSYDDGWHAAEKMSLMVVEEGVHELVDGTVLEAIRTQTDVYGGPVAYSRSNPDVVPTVFAQVTSNNGETLVVAKVKDVDNSDIEVDFQPEEKLQRNGFSFPIEDLDVVVVHPNTDFFLTKDLGRLNVNHNFSSVSKSPYNDPAIFTATQTENGGNPYVIRVNNISDEKFDVKLQEDTSYDLETVHDRPETLGYWVLEAGDLYALP